METDDFACCTTATNCAAGQSEAAPIQHCPACGKPGKKVGMETVKAMLAVTLHAIQPDRGYLFCRTVDCQIVYFADNGESIFTEQELRERVYQKHPDEDEVFVCYCFCHTPVTIRAEVLASGVSTLAEQINAGIAAGQCACEIRNPQGSCCLGNVSATVQRVKAEVKQGKDEAKQIAT